MKVAAFVGTHPGLPGIFNRLVRFVDRSPCSHVELVFSDGLCGSATGVDKGLRLKAIDLSDPRQWVVADLKGTPYDVDEATVRERFETIMAEARAVGGGYDFFGLFATTLPFLCREHPEDWFCSEVVMHCLGHKEAWRFNPATAMAALGVDLSSLTGGGRAA